MSETHFPGTSVRKRRASRVVGVLAVLGVALAASGCGTRLSHEETVEATRVIVTPDPGGATVAVPGAVANPVAPTTTGSLQGVAPPAQGAGTAKKSGTTATGSAGGNSPTGGTRSGQNPAAGVAAPEVANSSPITLGNIGTYSGVIGEGLKGLQEALQVWAAYTNDHGGLNGHPVKVIIGNDGGDPSTALTIAKRMVQQDKILAFVDPFLLFDFNEITAYAADVNVPLIGGDGTDARWYTTPIAFPQTATLVDTVGAANREVIGAGQKKVGIVYCVEIANLCAPIADYVKTTAQAAGGQFVFSASASFTAPSFTSICINAKQAGTEALWVFLDGPSESRLARDCKAQGYSPRYVIAATNTTASVIADPNHNGTVVSTSSFPSPATDTPAARVYHAAFEQYAPAMAKNLPGVTAQAWAAGQLAVAASGFLTGQPTSQEFLQGLWSIKNNNLGGLTTPLTFVKGKGSMPAKCAFVAGIKDGTYVAPRGSKLLC